jgi:hypothetical protein
LLLGVCCQALPVGLDVLDIPWKHWRAKAAHTELKAERLLVLVRLSRVLCSLCNTIKFDRGAKEENTELFKAATLGIFLLPNAGSLGSFFSIYFKALSIFPDHCTPNKPHLSSTTIFNLRSFKRFRKPYHVSGRS